MKVFTYALTVLLTSFSFAYTNETSNKQKKIYVDSSKVQVNKEGILIELGNKDILVKSLRSDKNGLYIVERDVAYVYKRHRRHEGSGDEYYCDGCGNFFHSRRSLKDHDCSG